MINLEARVCEACDKCACYGFKGQHARTCRTHRLVGMINLRARVCEMWDKCASYGFDREWPRRCAPHALPGMLNVLAYRCGTEGCDEPAHYKDPDGSSRFCGGCALDRGLRCTFAGASFAACGFFDAWERLTGDVLPHVHFSRPGTPTTGAEATGLVPGRRLLPDAYVAEQIEVCFFHGDYYHGYPPQHPKHETHVVGGLGGPDWYHATMDATRLFGEHGYSVKYV